MIELRDLKSRDIFPMIGILKKIGFRQIKTILTPERMQDMTNAAKAHKDGESADTSTILGYNILFEIASIVIDNLESCEQEVYRFLAGISDKSAEELADLPMAEFGEMIVAVIQKPEFSDFFKAVSKLFN